MNDFASKVKVLRDGQKPEFPPNANTLEYAQSLDAQDQLSHFRDEFIIPTRASLKKKALDGIIPGIQTNGTTTDADTPCIYFVGNSLGAQPKAVRRYLEAQLETWASIGVNGHFSSLSNSPLTPWQDMAADCAAKSAAIVGAADPSEVVIMNTLTVNLHFMLASFYRPTDKRHKIILEWRPFPSDWYAFQSQIEWHGLDPEKSMVEMQPDENLYLSPEKILATIDEHAEDAALLLLPGIQYYTGQLFDIPRITQYAQERGIVVGWDLAHCAGNVELQLHDWNVDFAVWCTYKYLNGGPGSMAGAFVHERHGKVDMSSGKPVFKPRLSGWYGADKSVRFNMDKEFQPTPGAQGFQVSNPSAIDLTSLAAALSVFNKTSMKELRSKALVLTAYTEHLLDEIVRRQPEGEEPAFKIITPRDPLQRGTQLSLLLRDGLMDTVAAALEAHGVVCDKRKPNVIRVAPVPMYCRFEDVWKFMEIFEAAIRG
ncbi:hypothetical protein NEUTE1DRAFT_145950 [Neurospora tetrasperma FGSC 2508]|uniref:Kynureninase n=1 Tax=Neurospora tetrasperma (strain FGSC 2508 / ATCC MYA-4615 / P0657) TaxID=510951 RepID=F8MJM3_NEUT8|nr:uncharacterized protein NEUTE1DRAFT_145950 [Neurospora tetrasperma FGSC 2508]EGO57264.1 hypothetical protein NEUTE1DRAFT_145950 [Neurospora tetrasperma FGSC 2508]EGZ72489.1 kynureninase [Neurospora tetrasperma FGSC 2509]